VKPVISTPGRARQLPGQESHGNIRTIRGFLILEIVIFLSMISIHFGLLIGGYGHGAAGAVESVIAVVLIAGLVLTWTPPPGSRRAATAAQSFGILGILVGLFTIALGIGPRTTLDLALNGALLLILIAGLVTTLRRSVVAGPTAPA
jgi:hypothetical protein